MDGLAFGRPDSSMEFGARIHIIQTLLIREVEQNFGVGVC